MKRNVLIFIYGGVGGAERMSVNIAKMLPDDKYTVKFVVYGTHYEICEFIPSNFYVRKIWLPLRVLRIFRNNTIWPLMVFLIILKNYRPDIVFSSNSIMNSAVIFAAKIMKTPVVVRNSGTVNKYDSFLKYLLRRSYPLADAIIAQQQEMKNEIITLLGVNPDKVYSLQNPLDISTISIKIKAPCPLPANQVNYVLVGRFHKIKAQDIAIRAFCNVSKEISNAHFYFVGLFDENDRYYQQVKKYADDNGIIGRVHFVGYDNNPYKWVKGSNVFVFPSRIEGLPNALIEASYLGVPCVATRCLDVIDEIVKDGYNGYKVEIDDIEGLASGMINALELKSFEMTYKPATPTDFVSVFDNL